MRPTLIDVEGGTPPPKRMIVIAVPTLGMVSIRWMICMQGLQAPMNQPVAQLHAIGREVGAARNNLVQRALAMRDHKTGASASHLFFVDDDCLLSMSALTQLWAHQQPIMAGLYYTKTVPPQPLMLASKHGGVVRDFRHGDVVPCWAHGMGCTLIDLEVFRSMYRRGYVETTDARCPVPGCQDSRDESLGCFGECLGCFGTGREIRWFYTTSQTLTHGDLGPEFRRETEDVYFCERALQAGYQPTVDTGVFAFHYAAPPIHYDDDRLPSDVCYPLEQWLEYQKTQRVTWPEAVPA